MSMTMVTDRVKELVKEVKAGVSRIRESEDWKRWLDMNAKFWKYSFHNQMLITIQKPSASLVAGFNTWKKLGRYVKKGEHGIYILAPRIVKVKEENSEEVQHELQGFLAVSVFDVGQTEGKELPSVFHPLNGSAPDGVFGKLWSFVKDQGYTVRFEEMTDGSYGYLTNQKEIVLKKGESTAQTLDTMCHELAHGLLGHVGNRELSREEKELEAETTAWIVCRNLGLETRESSFGYLATWLRNEQDGKLERAGQRACDVAKKVLEGLNGSEVKA